MAKNEMKEIEEIANEPEISIWVDKYDDVFSDFDSRPYTDRGLSDDFLREVRKMISEKTGDEVGLKFHLLADMRNPETEEIITFNLKTHFKHIADNLKKERRQILKRGYTLLGIGFVLILFIFYLTTLATKDVYLEGFILMLEPVGWFMTWTGMDNVFQNSRKGIEELHFNTRMASAKIAFESFGMVMETNNEEIENASLRHKTVIPVDNNNLRVA